ncbi:hypothetical protein BJ546DRAFT_9200 [Cryomyces antarcticus]
MAMAAKHGFKGLQLQLQLRRPCTARLGLCSIQAAPLKSMPTLALAASRRSAVSCMVARAGWVPSVRQTDAAHGSEVPLNVALRYRKVIMSVPVSTERRDSCASSLQQGTLPVVLDSPLHRDRDRAVSSWPMALLQPSVVKAPARRSRRRTWTMDLYIISI